MKTILALVPFLVCLNAHSEELLLLGGDNHATYLGCVNCGANHPDSICNQYGRFGSKFSVQSIWNPFGTWGNKFSVDSPWNPFSQSGTVPVLADKRGTNYGAFSINTFRIDAGNFSARLKQIYEDSGEDLEKTSERICSASR